MADFCRRARELPDHRAEQVKTIGDALLLRSPDPGMAVLLGVELAENVGGGPEFPGVGVGVNTGRARARGASRFALDPVCRMAVYPTRARGRPGPSRRGVPLLLPRLCCGLRRVARPPCRRPAAPKLIDRRMKPGCYVAQADAASRPSRLLRPISTNVAHSRASIPAYSSTPPTALIALPEVSFGK